MNQRVQFHFDMMLADKYYAFSCQPGVNFDEIDAALMEFQLQFIKLKAEAEEKEKKDKAQAAAKEVQESPAEVVSVESAPVSE